MEFNVIIDNGNVLEGDVPLFFAENEPENLVFSKSKDMWELLTELKLFPSKSQARKDPKWGKIPEIPKGFNEFEFGKKKIKVFIFNPSL
jgi:hypothetical protein